MSTEWITGIVCCAVVVTAVVGARSLKRAGEEEWLRHRIANDPSLRLSGVFTDLGTNLGEMRKAIQDATAIMKKMSDEIRKGMLE